MIKTAITITFINQLLSAFCLPLVTMINGANYGLTFESWLGCGLLYAAIAFVICYVVYTLFVRKIFCERGLVSIGEKEQENIKRDRKLLVKIVSVATAIALVLGVCVVVWNNIGWDGSMKELTFDKCDDFKAFMENDYEEWYKEGYSYVDENGDVVVHVPLAPGDQVGSPDDEKYDEDYMHLYPKKVYKKSGIQMERLSANITITPDLYERIIFTESADDKMPVTVITNQANYDGRNTFQTVKSILYTLIVIDFVAAAGIYLIKIKKAKKTA